MDKCAAMIEEYVKVRIEAKESEVCEWHVETDCDDDVWNGSCGIKWVMVTGTPSGNGMVYCPKCGRKLVEKVEEPKEGK